MLRFPQFFHRVNEKALDFLVFVDLYFGWLSG